MKMLISGFVVEARRVGDELPQRRHSAGATGQDIGQGAKEFIQKFETQKGTRQKL